MKLALIVNGEEQNGFPLIDGNDPFNNAAERTAMDQAYEALAGDPSATVTIQIMQDKREYMDARFDITDLSDNERSNLALEVNACAEASPAHKSVEVELEWNEVVE